MSSERKYKKETRTVEEGPVDELAEDDAQDHGPELPDDLEELLSSAGEARVDIYGRAPGARSTDNAYVTTLDPDDWSLEWLQETFGAGIYEIRVRGDGGRWRRSKTVRVAGPLKYFREDDDGDGRQEGRRNAEFAAFMAESLATLKALRDDLRNPPAGAQGQSPVETALSMMNAIQSATNPLVERLLDAERSKTDPMELFMRGVELAQSFQGDGDGIGSVLRPLVVPLARRLEAENIKERQAEGAQVATEPAGPSGERPPEWVHFLRPQVATLLRPARRGGDPGLYAEVIADEVEGNTEVEAFLESATSNLQGFLVDFFRWNPDAEPYKRWFVELWVELGRLLGTIPETEPEEDDQGPEDVSLADSEEAATASPSNAGHQEDD